MIPNEQYHKLLVQYFREHEGRWYHPMYRREAQHKFVKWVMESKTLDEVLFEYIIQENKKQGI